MGFEERERVNEIKLFMANIHITTMTVSGQVEDTNLASLFALIMFASRAKLFRAYNIVKTARSVMRRRPACRAHEIHLNSLRLLFEFLISSDFALTQKKKILTSSFTTPTAESKKRFQK